MKAFVVEKYGKDGARAAQVPEPTVRDRDEVTSEVHPLPEGQHSFVLGAGRVPEVDRAIQQMGQWLRRHLGT